MRYHNIKSHAKINLALNIVGKKKKLHKIESVISFLDLHDEISIKKIKKEHHKIQFTGEFSSSVKVENTVSKLLNIIDKKKLLKDKFQIVIKKNIPPKAGLGGGSMNASSILNFLSKKSFIKLSKKEIINISDLIGSDVKLGIHSRNLILRSNNTIKTFPKKRIFVLIVKPNFGCSTKKIYSKVKKFSKAKFNKSKKRMFNFDYLKKYKNDLELIAFNNHPKLKILKNFLEKISDIEFVRMTGSGSAIVAYFNSDKKCDEIAKKVKKKFKNCWCKISKTI